MRLTAEFINISNAIAFSTAGTTKAKLSIPELFPSITFHIVRQPSIIGGGVGKFEFYASPCLVNYVKHKFIIIHLFRYFSMARAIRLSNRAYAPVCVSYI